VGTTPGRSRVSVAPKFDNLVLTGDLLMPRQLLLLAPREVALASYDDPPVSPSSALLKTLFSGVSHGTEMLLYRGHAPKFEHSWDDGLRHFHTGVPGVNGKPLSMGYETVARVEAVGEDVRDLAPGDVVWIDAPHRETHVVDTGKAPPFWRFGPVADPKVLTFFALCRVALGAVHDAEPLLGGSALVCGLGTVGQLCVQLLKRSGVRTVFGIDRYRERLDIAESFGAIPVPIDGRDPAEVVKASFGAVDVAIEASGAYAGLAAAMRCVAPMGRVVVVSSYGNQSSGIVLGHEFHRNRITLVSSMTVNGCPHSKSPLWSLDRLNREASALLSEGSLDVGRLITSVVPFDGAVDAYRAIADADSPPLKVVFDYDRS
jgi:threonine dehydrogenase-like Zn-dependent dehydrogenase